MSADKPAPPRERVERNIEVIVPVRGLRDRADRVATVLTGWQIRWKGDAPRLITPLRWSHRTGWVEGMEA